MTSTQPLSYAAVSLTPRPPRVVVVIDGGEHWSYWARRALYRAGRVWGGAGFAVVPHRDGQVQPVLLRACEAYDPDFVVTYSPALDDLEHFHPGTFQITGSNGELLTGEERARHFEMVRSQQVHVDAEATAHERIAAVCSTYQARDPVEREDTVVLVEEPTQDFPEVKDLHSTWAGSVLACPATWGGSIGAAVAAHAGVAEAPRHDAGEPELDVQTRNQVV